MATMSGKHAIFLFPTSTDLFRAVAENFTQQAIESIHNKGQFFVVFSGGETPQSFFDALTSIPFCRDHTPWENIQFFFADERYVPYEDPANNYHMAYEHLFSNVPVPASNIHPIPTDYPDPKQAALAYESSIRNCFQLHHHEVPKFDVIYLGLGRDGHTASLMPNIEFDPSQSDQLVIALWIPELDMNRITLTPLILNNASCIKFLVSGESKASIVWEVLNGAYDPKKHPAQLIHGANGNTQWYLDQAAGKEL